MQPINAEKRICTFFLNGLWFGVEVESVREVLSGQAVTRVPLAPEAVAGLINLRGQIVTAIDLRARLGLPAHNVDQTAMHIVVKSAGDDISLLVDEVVEIVSASPDSYQSAPESLSTESRRLVPGVYELSDGLLHALALDAVCGGNTQETAEALRRE